MQAKKAELKEALAAAEAELRACRDGNAGGGGGAVQAGTRGRERGGSVAQQQADEGDAPAPQRGGEHRTPDAHAAGIDPEAAARDKAAANGGS